MSRLHPFRPDDLGVACLDCYEFENDPLHISPNGSSAEHVVVDEAEHQVVDDPINTAGAVLEDPVLVPSSAAFHGLAGEVVAALCPHTEADPAALVVGFLAEFGGMVGQTASARVSFANHPPALFAAFVGRTSRSRKGTATADTGGLMRHVEVDWHARHQISGFGSGEALIEHASQAPGEAIFMIEPELARLLAVASREGSSASSALRSAWDFRRMEHRIRRQVYDAPPAPVTLIGHITIDELRDSRHGLRPMEIMNGFGNRVLWVFVDRRRLVPDLQPVPERVLSPLVRRIREALTAARRGPALLTRTPEAVELWRDLYARMANDDGSGLVDALTGRAEAQVLRLSLIYALTDGSPAIDRVHLEAAWEVWRYCRWSAQRIWVGRGTGDPDLDRIAAVLASGEEITGRELDRMFLGHRSAAELRERAVAFGIAREVTRPTGGRNAVVLVAAGKADKAEKGWWVRPTFTLPAASSASSALPASEDEHAEVAARA